MIKLPSSRPRSGSRRLLLAHDRAPARDPAPANYLAIQLLRLSFSSHLIMPVEVMRIEEEEEDLVVVVVVEL